jgi:hypothetical protein
MTYIGIGGVKGFVGKREERGEKFQILSPTPLDRVCVQVVEVLVVAFLCWSSFSAVLQCPVFIFCDA